MTTVPTARGVVTGSDLGRTHLHEHVLVVAPDVPEDRPGDRGQGRGGEDDRIADAVRRLTALADRGVRTIVDPTVVGPGRHVPWIQRIADQVPQLNIVLATGVATDASDPAPVRLGGPERDLPVGRELPDPLVDRLVRDLTDGIAGTGVRAGMLSCAIGRQGLTQDVERVLRAVARAHHATDAPITVHTHPVSRTGLAVRRVLCDEEGVEPRRVVLGHSGDTPDVDHLVALADAGFVLGMDRFGRTRGTTFAARVDTLVELCRRGYAASMVLSPDASCSLDRAAPTLPATPPPGNPPVGNHLHQPDAALSYVRAAGVGEDELTQMLVDVPRRVLAG